MREGLGGGGEVLLNVDGVSDLTGIADDGSGTRLVIARYAARAINAMGLVHVMRMRKDCDAIGRKGRSSLASSSKNDASVRKQCQRSAHLRESGLEDLCRRA